MKFEPKMSGTKVTDFEIEFAISHCVCLLEEVAETIKRQETMNYILDTFRFTKIDAGWACLFDHDTLYKIAVLEKYPEYEKEFINYFGENWLKHYIRFNH